MQQTPQKPYRPKKTVRLHKFFVPLALLLTYCDLGNFEPEDIFARRPLEEDAIQLTPDDAAGCNTTFFANQDDIAPTTDGYEIKGSLYFENSFGETVYFTNGEFQVLTNNGGDLVTMTGFGLALFPDLGIFEQASQASAYTADMELNTGGFFNESGDLPLEANTCYIKASVNEGPAILNTEQGVFEYQRYFLSPSDPFVLFEGSFELNNLALKDGLVGISYNGLIPFEPSPNEDILFETFDGHLFARGSLPFAINNIPAVSTGESVVNAAPPGFDEAAAFFNGNPVAYHQGNEGALAIGYGMIDAILAKHSFYNFSDTSNRPQDTLLIDGATSVLTFESGTEQFDFAGRYADTLNLYQELLPTHPILQRLSLEGQDSVGIYGNFGTNQETWSISAQSAAKLELGDVATLQLEQAILSLTSNTVEFSGLFVSPFAHIPNLLVAGEIDEDGDLLLQGKRTVAVFYGNVTLPTTFFMTVEIEGGIPSVRIDAQAEDCGGNECIMKMVDVTFDFDTGDSQLCIDNGASCTN